MTSERDEPRREEDRIVVYGPASMAAEPHRLFFEMARDLRKSGRLGWELARRDVSARYRQTAFGYFWAVAPSLATALLFLLLHKAGILEVGLTGVRYSVFVLTGTFLWQSFAESVAGPLRAVQTELPVLGKIRVPTEALIVSASVQVLLDLALKLAVLFALVLPMGAPVRPTSAFLAVPILALLLWGIGAGLLLVPVGILFRDVQNGLPLLLMGLLFFAPVVYSVPDVGLLRSVISWNPLTPPLLCARDLIYTGRPDLLPAAILSGGGGLLLFAAGWTVCRLAMPIVVERMGA